MIVWQEVIDQQNLFWQYPVRTEKEFYFQNKFFEDYLGFPWATILDKQLDLNRVLHILEHLLDKNIKYYTCCQHIRFRELKELFEHLNIKTLYTPHKCLGEDTLASISLIPCPLFAVNVEDSSRNSMFLNKDLVQITRKYLYSFMGGLQPGYLSDIRTRIFDLTKNEDAYIKNTGGWHFNELVYSNFQNFNQDLFEPVTHKNKTEKYNEVLLNSRYSLCPSGTGPNSIRFWESLAIGAIPVLLSDTLELPKNNMWKDTILRFNEADLDKALATIKNTSHREENIRRKNCLDLYMFYKFNYQGSII